MSSIGADRVLVRLGILMNIPFYISNKMRKYSIKLNITFMTNTQALILILSAYRSMYISTIIIKSDDYRIGRRKFAIILQPPQIYFTPPGDLFLLSFANFLAPNVVKIERTFTVK